MQCVFLYNFCRRCKLQARGVEALAVGGVSCDSSRARLDHVRAVEVSYGSDEDETKPSTKLVK